AARIDFLNRRQRPTLATDRCQKTRSPRKSQRSRADRFPMSPPRANTREDGCQKTPAQRKAFPVFSRCYLRKAGDAVCFPEFGFPQCLGGGWTIESVPTRGCNARRRFKCTT